MKKLLVILLVNLGLGLGMGFIQTASALATYDAFSSFSIRVDAVSNVDIEVEGDALVDLDAIGNANAGGGVTFSVNDAAIFSFETSVQDEFFVREFISGPQALGLGDTARWTSNAFGDVDGFDSQAFSVVLNDALIDLFSFDQGSATISWLYLIEASTGVDDLFLESAEAFAAVDFFDEFDQGVDPVFNEVFSSEVGDDFFTASGVWDFDFSGDFNTMTGFVDADGIAQTSPAPVPEPATMLLFGVGLAGLVGSRLGRRK